jgi:hypothetical protein
MWRRVTIWRPSDLEGSLIGGDAVSTEVGRRTWSGKDGDHVDNVWRRGAAARVGLQVRRLSRPPIGRPSPLQTAAAATRPGSLDSQAGGRLAAGTRAPGCSAAKPEVASAPACGPILSSCAPASGVPDRAGFVCVLRDAGLCLHPRRKRKSLNSLYARLLSYADLYAELSSW